LLVLLLVWAVAGDNVTAANTTSDISPEAVSAVNSTDPEAPSVVNTTEASAVNSTEAASAVNSTQSEAETAADSAEVGTPIPTSTPTASAEVGTPIPTSTPTASSSRAVTFELAFEAETKLSIEAKRDAFKTAISKACGVDLADVTIAIRDEKDKFHPEQGRRRLQESTTAIMDVTIFTTVTEQAALNAKISDDSFSGQLTNQFTAEGIETAFEITFVSTGEAATHGVNYSTKPGEIAGYVICGLLFLLIAIAVGARLKSRANAKAQSTPAPTSAGFTDFTDEFDADIEGDILAQQPITPPKVEPSPKPAPAPVPAPVPPVKASPAPAPAPAPSPAKKRSILPRRSSPSVKIEKGAPKGRSKRLPPTV
jgi:outer membrane biosynthesis protein TonB